MTISRVKPANWAVNEKLTSAQMNAVDTNSTYALDKRNGQTDTLSSAVTVAFGSSLAFANGSTLSTVAGVTASINSNISFGATASFGVFSTASFSGVVNFNTSSVVNMNGTANIAATAVHNYGAATVVYAATTLNGTATSGLTFLTGSTMLFNAGSTVTFNGTSNLGGTVNITGVTTAADFTMTGTNKVKLASRQVTRTVCSNFIPATSNWSLQSDTLGTPITTSNANGYGFIPLALPTGAVITAIAVYVEGGAGHAGAPANMPQMSLVSKTLSSGGTGSILATQVDAYVSAANYESLHTIQIAGLSTAIVRTSTKYGIYVQSESGANALAGFKIHGVSIVYTTRSMDDGPCN